MTELLIPARFNGSPGSANGGFLAGRMASLLGGVGDTMTVNLRAPGPLDTPMSVTESPDGDLRAHCAGVLIADVRRAADPGDAGEPVAAVSAATAAAAMRRFRALVPGPVATCLAASVTPAARPTALTVASWVGPTPCGYGPAEPTVAAMSEVGALMDESSSDPRHSATFCGSELVVVH